MPVSYPCNGVVNARVPLRSLSCKDSPRLLQDPCVGCCLPSFELAFQWPRTLHRTTAELNCSKIHDSFSDTKVRRRCLPDDSWGPADISSCTFKNRTRNTIFLLSTNVTISGERNREDVLDEIQTIFENQVSICTIIYFWIEQLHVYIGLWIIAY